MKMNRIIYKGKLKIELEEDIVKLKTEIRQLKKLKQEILKSPAYCLLDGKTQMIDEKKENAIRSRLDHTNNVASIAKRIIGRIYDLCSIKEISDTEIFKLNKERAELYTEITALSHDLGHTPFGHSGEAVVNEFMQSIQDKETIEKIIARRKECFGEEYEEEQGHTGDFKGRLSFEHNEQSALEFHRIIERSSENFSQINIEEIITGILAHSISRVPEVPKALIAQIVRQTDKIEYRNRDYEEVMEHVRYSDEEEELKRYQSIPAKQRIRQIIEDIANEAVTKGRIEDDNDALKMCKKLRKKYENIVYLLDKDGKRGLLTGDNRERQQMIYKRLLEYYYQHPEKIPTKSMTYNNPIDPSKDKKRVVAFDKTKIQEETPVEMAIGYVNTFTNKKCEDMYIRLVKERTMKGKGHGIEPITKEEIEERKKIQIGERVAKMKGKDIYKGIETHTDQEYISMLQRKNQNFIENDLTEEAKEIIKENKMKHQKENEEDELLRFIVKKADEERKEMQERRQKEKTGMNNLGGEEVGI